MPAGAISQPVSFGADVDGELYVASLTGQIFRIRDLTPVSVPALAPLAILVGAAALLGAGLRRLRRVL